MRSVCPSAPTARSVSLYRPARAALRRILPLHAIVLRPAFAFARTVATRLPRRRTVSVVRLADPGRAGARDFLAAARGTFRLATEHDGDVALHTLALSA